MVPQYIKGSQYVIYQFLRETGKKDVSLTQNKIAQQTGYDPRTVNRAILALEELGHIRVERSRGRHGNRYEVVEGVSA